MLRKRFAAAIVAAAALIGSATVAAVTSPTAQAATSVPVFDHIVLVMFENHAYSQINGSSSAPYFNSLASQGAKFTQSYAITHPSQPNYLAIFSGSTQGVTNDNCPLSFNKNNIANQLLNNGKTFKSYSEAMPSDGYTGCSSGTYRRKHNAAPDFPNVPASSNVRFSTFPSSGNYASLPTVSYVAPDMCNDMHDCSISTGDTWLKNKMDAYAQWAKTHNSLLIVTFDEDNSASSNHIFTTFVGAHTQVGSFSNQINHYNVLSTIESAYGLAQLNSAAAITNVWN
ncbi:alkaline phosphatase family protein [Micromonospora globispora]|uniref:alkaline phosphatase family protein n=1 Tax=Micromonospora globispora TaxID=1450148 RepID=UPI001FB03B56|nr:alkaline phosphatase family protein [Micromonospora globispora]